MKTQKAAESAIEKSDPEPSAGTPRRKRRKDGLARHALQLEVARDLFLERGYAETSVNDVARIAGGSLATLYREFGNKEGLFLAVVQEYLHDEVPPSESVLDPDISLADGLQVIGEGYMKTLLQPDRIALNRIFATEGRQIPHLMRRFQNFSEESSRGWTRRLLDKHVEAGSIRPVDTKWTASFFIEMLRAHHFVSAVYNPRYVLSPEDRREHVTRAVDLTCNGLLPRAS